MQSSVLILATFAVPVILIMLFNIFVAVRIYFTLRPRIRTSTSESRDSRRRIRTMIAVTTLFGLTLVFGAVTLIDVDSWFSTSDKRCILPLVFHYLFAICNSLQGLLVFVFTVLLSSHRRQSIINFFTGERGRGVDRQLMTGTDDLDRERRLTLDTFEGLISAPRGRTLLRHGTSSDTSLASLTKFEIPEEIQQNEVETAALY